MTYHDKSIGPKFTTWAEIDLSAIAHNVRELRRVTNPGARLMVAVKANGYGHGAVPTARIALANGATDVGVARMEEGIALRRVGISAPVLVFGYTPAQHVPQLIAYQLTPAVYSLEHAQALSAAALAAGQQLPIHVKVDTGMGRLGLPCDELRLAGLPQAGEEIIRVAALKGVRLQGIFTHFATADHADLGYARAQFERFQKLLAELKSAGCVTPLRHAANSGAIMQLPETHLDMVRAGISVYGLYPSGEVNRATIDLKPAMTLKSTIIQLKQVPAGACISYGCTYKTPAPTTIATVSVGYADGYSRGLSNKGTMLAGGCRAPIVGRVCMDLTMIDVGRIPNVSVGDEVVLVGCQGETEISADEVAATLGTINYEVVSALTERVERIYIKR
ncbi:MAG: alanine racemase [Desulfobacteraceae bacterium]|nr:alanine racemase [Desulfobacteraceae bacterium]